MIVMIQGIFKLPVLRRYIDKLPSDNRCLNCLRILAKAILFRRRIVRSRRVVFPGLEDAVLENSWGVGAGPGEILVRSLYTAVSPGTERAGYLNLPNFRVSWPYQPGYSGCGRVLQAGRGVSGFRRGDLVAGIFKHSSLNILDPAQVVPVPPGVKPEEAAFVTLGVIARCGVRAARIAPGGKVLVLGLGILGQLAIRMARNALAGEVWAASRSGSGADSARMSGAATVFALEGDGASRPPSQPDVVIDATGALQGFISALEMVRAGGRVVMLGSLPGLKHTAPWPELVVRKNLAVAGAHIRNLASEGLDYPGEATAFLADLAGGKIPLGHLIAEVCRPEDAPALYRSLAAGGSSPSGLLFDWRNCNQETGDRRAKIIEQEKEAG